MLIHEILESSADRGPQNPALWFLNRWMTYGEAEARSNNLAAHLIDAGIRPGDRVAVLLDNSFDFVAVHFGISKAGAVNVSLNTEITPQGLVQLVEDSGARALVAGRKYHSVFAKAAAAMPGLIHLVCEAEDAPEAGPGRTRAFLSGVLDGPPCPRPSVPRVDLDLAAIVYTSGSTGRPKGVMLSHLNLMSNNRSIVRYLGIGPSDRVMAVLPFYYIYGLSLLYTHLSAGAAVLMDNRFAYPNVVLDVMAKQEATGFAGVPSTYMILLHKSALSKSAFPCLRYVTQAGGALAPALQREVVKAFAPARLFVMYGATEAAPRLTYLEPELLPVKWGSIGRAVPNVDVFVAGPDGRRLPAGEVGEIAARGSNIMMGYWNDPAGTAEVLREGVYYTGDLGREDGDGCLFIEGRIKDIIKAGGNRVGAKEIEEALVEAEGVLEAAVIGVEDPILGEAIKAFLVPKNGGIDLEKVKEHLRRMLPAFKQPKWIEVRPSLPKNAAGKVLKAALREEGARSAAAAPSGGN